MTKFITNQNIEIKLRLAGLGDRILAFFIDLLIIVIYVFGVAFFLAVTSAASPLLNFLFMLPVLFYSLLFEIFGNGQTPGKMHLNVKVVKLDGGAPGIVHYLLRWVLRPIDILLYGCVAMLCIMITKNGQRLGDLAAGTTVIKQLTNAPLTLSDVASQQTNPNYQVSFPQVKRLNDKQIDLIRRTLKMRKEGFNAEATSELAEKVCNLLQIENNMPPVKFLYIIIKDYEQLQA